nr:hypothetical protein [Tanacetum cinerariifolium]
PGAPAPIGEPDAPHRPLHPGYHAHAAAPRADYGAGGRRHALERPGALRPV